ncbi:MAG: chloride channel protein [Alloprevotella sp.]|nr:chloride channel protein [Alloprevotella sp.]
MSAKSWLTSLLSVLLGRFSGRQLLLLLSLAVGVAASLAAQLLKWLIEEIKFLLTYQFDATQANRLYLVYPVVGILLTTLFVRIFVRDNIGHGITKILYSLSRERGRLKPHNTWSSLIASALTIGFGGSVGAESPIVLTGSAIGADLGEVFKLTHKRRILLIGCGAAAAAAGIFKAPIAGVLFALEVLMIDLTMSSLLPLLISALTATCVAYAISGTDAMFDFQLVDAFGIRQVPSCLLLGALCGLVAFYATQTMVLTEDLFRRIGGMLWRVLIGGAMLAVLIFLFPPLYGEGYDTVSTLLAANSELEATDVLRNSLFYAHPELLLLFLALIVGVKSFATAATNGAGGCGGTFAPSLFLGCLTGFIFSDLWNRLGLLSTTLPVRNYVLLGMAGLMSAFFQAPLTGVFLIAELTGGYQLFLPLMIVSATAYLTVQLFLRRNIYAIRLDKQGNLLTHDTDRNVLTLMSLDTVVDAGAPRLTPEMTLGQLVQTVANDERSIFPVCDPLGNLVGIIDFGRIRRYIFRSELYQRFRVSELMSQPEAELYKDDTMERVMEKFRKSGAGVLPVVDNQNRFVGFINHSRLLENYRQLVKDYSEE